MTTKLIIVHGGQTGVDRGAHFAARDTGLVVEGYMPHDGTDERGLIPAGVAQFLTRCKADGLMQRTVKNLELCDALLSVVEDRLQPWATPGTAFTMQTARIMQRPRICIDEGVSPSYVIDWVRGLCSSNAKGGVLRLMVAGPRESRWASGERVADFFIYKLGYSFTGQQSMTSGRVR